MDTRKKKITTKRIVNIALFASICFIGTWINIPIQIGGATSMVHLGTTAIFLSAIFIGKDAGLAGGIGCAMFDALNPNFVMWVIPTFIIKGLTGYVVGKIVFSKRNNGDKLSLNIFAFIVGGIVSLLGYFIFNWVFFVGFYGAITSMITSIVTTAIGAFLAVPLCASKKLVKKSNVYSN